MAKALQKKPVESDLSLSFVDDLNPAKDMWNMKVRIIRKWSLSFRMDLILLDEKGCKIQAGIKSPLIPHFDPQLQEDDVVILSKFGVGENKDPYKVLKHDYKINFYRCTTVTPVSVWDGPDYGFNFMNHAAILNGEWKELLTVDVAGSVVWCGNMDIFRRPPKETKRMNFDLQDVDGTIVRCTMWNNYAQQFNDFVSQNGESSENLMAVIQHAKVKEWKDEITVQSDKFGTRLFLNQEIDELNQLRHSLILKQGQACASSSQTVLSSQTVFPVRQEFLIEYQKKHVDQITEIEKAMSCIVVATIKIVQESYGWFYPACRKCFKKVMSKGEYLQYAKTISEDVVNLSSSSFICPKCDCECASITTKFKVQVRVQDETGSVSFVMFDKDVMKIVGSTAGEIRERQLKDNSTDQFPLEIRRLVEKKLAFKIEVSDYNLEHDYHVYTVQKVCDDPEIIAELVGNNGNDPNHVDEVSQEDSALKLVQLSDVTSRIFHFPFTRSVCVSISVL